MVPEHVWAGCTSPYDLLLYAGPLATERKLALFACECQRRIAHLLDEDAPGRRWIDALERFADGHLARSGLPASLRDAESMHIASVLSRDAALSSARLGLLDGADELRQQAALVRDLFGPLPFQPVALDPAWLTGTVTALARGIYDDRAFHHLPVLADALEDAGCGTPAVLSHCRAEGLHVRGCWVIDLVLGKE